jgi:dTDP-4-amino-4,6-dideoxygalactose transaminase
MNFQKVPFNDLSRIHEPFQVRFAEATLSISRNSGFVLGEEVLRFERSYAALEEADFCIGIDNGTNSIELMLRAAGISNGDEVITTALTFVATVFAIERIGAVPILVDIESNSPLMDPAKIEEKITPRTKAILVVSLHGRVANIAEYSRIAGEHNLCLLLDGAQSHLAKYQGKKLSHFFAAISTSFYPGKNLGALGEGGAVLTNNRKIAEKVRLYRDWGAASKYEHSDWGGNFRLHALQASFLSIKIEGIEHWTEQRRQIGKTYNSKINPIFLRKELSTIEDHVYHIYEIKVRDRLEAGKILDQAGISWGIHYPKSIAKTAAYRHLGVESYPNAENFSSHTISLPLFPLMTDHEQTRVVSAVERIELRQ